MSKKEVKEAIQQVDVQEDPMQVIINLANQYLPKIMRVRLVKGELHMFLYSDTGLKNKEGHRITEWKMIHVLYVGDHIRDFIQGYIKGIESIANFEMMLKKTLEQQQFKQEVKVD